MITGVHAILSSTDAPKTRAFFRDVLGFRSIDAGRGWLIFALPPAELAAHPESHGGKHEMYLMCDDIIKTMAALTKKGVRFTRPVIDRGWGLLTSMKVPGGGQLWLYQPQHPTAITATRARKRSKRAARPAASSSRSRRSVR